MRSLNVTALKFSCSFVHLLIELSYLFVKIVPFSGRFKDEKILLSFSSDNYRNAQLPHYFLG